MSQPADFEIYTWGLVNASVCTSLPVENATQRLNDALPTGVGPWYPAEDKTFLFGQPNPNPCERRPSTHKHYLFHC